MAYVNTTNAPTMADRFTTLIDALATRRKQRSVTRRTFDELSALSNRELADLGMSRAQIRRIAIETGRNAV